MRTLGLPTIIAILTVWLFSCAKETKSTRPTKPMGTMSQQQASALISSSGEGLKMIALAKVFDQTSIQKQFVPVNAPGSTGEACGPVSSGDPTDTDGDGIPFNLNKTYACLVTTPTSYSIKGSFSVTDKNDKKAFPGAGLLLSISSFTTDRKDSSGNPAETIYTHGLHSVDVAGGVLSVMTEVVSEITRPNDTGTIGYYFVSETTPDSVSVPTASGKVTLKGFLESKMTSAIYTIEVSANGIVYGDCSDSSFFRNGVLTFKDGASNELTITYTNCTAKNRYNGTVF